MNQNCTAICITHGKRCSRKWVWKGFLCKQHYKLWATRKFNRAPFL